MKKIKLIIIIIIPMFIMTSCWSRREIEDLRFIMGLGISKTESGLYTVTVQFANPEAIVAEGTDQRSVYTILESEGVSVFDAFRNLTMISSGPLYVAHIKSILIDEAVAREGISNVLSFSFHDMEVRLGPEVFISKIPPKEIFDTPNTLGVIPAIAMGRAAENYGVNSKIYVSDFRRTLDAINNPVINYVTTLVEKIPGPTDKETDLLQLTQIAVFDNDKLKGYLDLEEGQGFNFITNNYENGLIVFETRDNSRRITIEMLESQTTIIPRYTDGKIGFDIELNAKGNIAESIPLANSPSEIDIESLQVQLDQVLEDKIRKSITAAQEKYNIDFFNLSRDFHKKYPKEFSDLKNEWNNNFSKADITIRVNSSIIHSALSTNRGKI